MRKILTLLIIFLSSFYSCSKPMKPSARMKWFEENGKIKVLTTLAMINELVKEIGKEKVDSLALISGQLDPHSYELVKGDDEKFLVADLIFYNGLGLEHGLSLRKALEGNQRAIAVGDYVKSLDPEALLTSEGQLDPHLWMDISLWQKTTGAIEKGLCEKDPQNATFYQKNAEELRMKLLKADQTAFEILQSVPEKKRYLVTSHDAFRYFTKHYLATKDEVKDAKWEIRCQAPEGLAPDAQLSVVDIQQIIDHVKKFQIHVLFPESNVSRDSLRKILSALREKECSARLSTKTLYGDSMGDKGYPEMILHNARVIADEWMESVHE